MSALCINAGGHRKAIREPQRRLQRRAYLPVASQTVQSGPCRRLAFCERITSHTSCASSSGRPTSYCNTMDTGDCPYRKKRRPWRMDFSSFALVTVMLIVCQTALVRAGKELYLARSYKNLLPSLVQSFRFKRLYFRCPACAIFTHLMSQRFYQTQIRHIFKCVSTIRNRICVLFICHSPF